MAELMRSDAEDRSSAFVYPCLVVHEFVTRTFGPCLVRQDWQGIGPAAKGQQAVIALYILGYRRGATVSTANKVNGPCIEKSRYSQGGYEKRRQFSDTLEYLRRCHKLAVHWRLEQKMVNHAVQTSSTSRAFCDRGTKHMQIEKEGGSLAAGDALVEGAGRAETLLWWWAVPSSGLSACVDSTMQGTILNSVHKHDYDKWGIQSMAKLATMARCWNLQMRAYADFVDASVSFLY